MRTLFVSQTSVPRGVPQFVSSVTVPPEVMMHVSTAGTCVVERGTQEDVGMTVCPLTARQGILCIHNK